MRTFQALITRCPFVHDASIAADITREYADVAAPLRDLLAASASCSPYLTGLIRQEAAWLRDAVQEDPAGIVPALCASCTGIAADHLGRHLRQTKRRVALFTALADLGGLWPLQTVTAALTAFADAATHAAISAFVADEIRRGKLPGARPEEAESGAGMVALAMGKMGAGELNYSSDIDLICLFDDSRYPDAVDDARATFIRVTRRMTALLSDITDQGYVFRTDLRLRPDAAVTPVCLSMSAAEAYYESVGRTWERAAYIKARPCAGDLAAGAAFLKTLVPFVWRKHLDFAAIQDAHDMRLRIRDHRGLHTIAVEGHDLKLGLGGIREIEFFTQTRQLIAGGRDVDLRTRTTLGGLARLAEKGWVPPDVAHDLTAHYTAHRTLEHRLQMVGDAQTHTMPTSGDAVARIAAFMGQEVTAFRADLLARLQAVNALTEGFFAPSTPVAAMPDLTPTARDIVAGWPSYPALRSERAQASFRRLRPMLLERLQMAANPDEALIAFDGFLAGLPAGAQLFALFEANPSLVELIVDIAATAPALARYLSRNARVLDAVIGGSFFAPWPGRDGLTALAMQVAAGATEYESQLVALRAWQKEWHFRIGVHHLRGLISASTAAREYADLAAATVAALFPAVCAEFSRKHGVIAGQAAIVVGMGSLGAATLNAGSDLDLILIYDAPPTAGADAMSDGGRPLGLRPYFARLTQMLVTALTAPMAEGRLYEVDMRLRPSGRQGPVATSWTSFQSYQRDEAWTWEHLALTRAATLAGDAPLAAEFEAFRIALLTDKGKGAAVRADVAAMRQRLSEARPLRHALDAKDGPGRLLDIDLAAQMLALLSGSAQRATVTQLSGALADGNLTVEQAGVLSMAHQLLWQMHAALRLLAAPADKLGQGAMAFLLRETGKTDAAVLAQAVDDLAGAAAGVIAGLTGPPLPDGQKG
ncbi:MAG: bifunctional [glutamine synthetase] adenylyltransferase/[glutamine synthetase]-adenylyl-L-tyrosine phosphorylase [Rhodobacteraceae bacterium]|nr:bifunctional [glutamine synthetase] adenylyltransferase/[glutamine synthetase]-adenylyl-L-tyrosine phosphorylase [Paracoccaceae bacterium]